MRTWPLAIVLSLGVLACGDNPPPRTEKPSPPTENDPAYTVDGVKEWWIVPNAATTDPELMTILVTVPSGTEFVDAWVGDVPVKRLAEQPNGQYGVQVSLAGLPPGTHQVLLAANGSTEAFARDRKSVV